MGGPESLGERLARQARDLVDQAGAKTGQLARIGRLHLDLLGIQRERDRELQNLGERAYELIRRREGSRIEIDPIAEPILHRIDELEAERTERERQIQELRAIQTGGSADAKRGLKREESA